VALLAAVELDNKPSLMEYSKKHFAHQNSQL
jgi:hypothetical protein